LVLANVLLVVGVMTWSAGVARAFTISSIVTQGCHELMTTEAFRKVRDEFAVPPLPATRNERALINDVQFKPAADMMDLGAATLLIGVRDNDLQGRDSNDLSQLALVHGNPNAQQLHCLRRPHDPEPGGTQNAILDCRTFFLDTVSEALDGLDAAGLPDPTIRTSLSLWLSLRHHVDAPLPTYYVRIGQAVHTAEDIFAHTFRTPDQEEVTVVVNWVDEVENDLNEKTDGPAHATQLDRCDDPDEFRTVRRMLATKAAEDILRATLDPTQTRGQKMAAVTTLIDGWLGYSPGCTFANQWCSAPERVYGNVALLRCDIGAPERVDRPAVAAFAVLILATRLRRRKRRVVLAATLFVVAGLGGAARADEPTSLPTEPPAAAAAHAPPPRTTPVAEPGPPDRSRPAVGGFLGVSGSGTNAAVAAALGLRVRATLHWTFGLDAEWNPWLAINGVTKARAGAFNGYGTAIFRVPLVYERINLRITGSFGATHTLIDLYGVPNGATGIYAAISPLGVEWKASRLFYLIINPLSFAAPVPQLSGIPFWYPQYRVSVGVEMYAR
jgi:hypothetical protein